MQKNEAMHPIVIASTQFFVKRDTFINHLYTIILVYFLILFFYVQNEQPVIGL